MNAFNSKYIRKFSILHILPLIVLTWAADAAAAVDALEKVSTRLASGQTVTTWATTNADGSIREAGVILPYSLIANPPDAPGTGPAGAIAVVPFPEKVRKNAFLNHFELNWEKHGHEPPVFMVPHFDFHFYSVNPEDLMAVTTQDPRQPESRLTSWLHLSRPRVFGPANGCARCTPR